MFFSETRCIVTKRLRLGTCNIILEINQLGYGITLPIASVCLALSKLVSQYIGLHVYFATTFRLC